MSRFTLKFVNDWHFALSFDTDIYIAGIWNTSNIIRHWKANQNITQQTTNNKNFSVLFIFGNDYYLLDLVRKWLTGIPPLHDWNIADTA